VLVEVGTNNVHRICAHHLRAERRVPGAEHVLARMTHEFADFAALLDPTQDALKGCAASPAGEHRREHPAMNVIHPLKQR